MRRGIRTTALVGLSLAVLAPAAAAQPDGAAPTERVLLLVDAAADPDAIRREERLAEELALALDGFAVQRIDLGGDFGFQPLADQLARVGPPASERGAAAAVWIRDAGSGRTMLHVAVLAAGQTSVRVVAFDSGASTEAELALAAREMLREARVIDLPEPAAAPVPPPAAAAAPCPPVAPPAGRPEWGLATLATAGGGVALYDGPSVRGGAALGVEWQPLDRLFARLAFAGAIGPRAELRDGVVTGWALELALAVGYGWRLGPIALGPFAAIAGSRSAVDVALGAGERRSYSWWGFFGALGLDLRVPLGRRAALVAEGAVGGSPSQTALERRSDGGAILSTPYIGWSAAVGAVVLLDEGK
jgi:hypothetical protein